MRPALKLFLVGATGLLLAGTAAVATSAGAEETGVVEEAPDIEAQRVDRVPTPELDWRGCYDSGGECATADLPLDYDEPGGTTVKIGLLRIKAKDQDHKIGSLFVNPGGPGSSSTEFAESTPKWLSPELLAKFDIVGADPRGLGDSERTRCFDSRDEQTSKLIGLKPAFPMGEQEEAAFIASGRELAKGCSTTGKQLAGAMSTAEVARDMDVLRRAVGDDKLTFLGMSYGTALGQYYANMFPDRFRAIIVDGVINPVSWVGDQQNDTTIDDRLHSSDGAWKALSELFERCDAAGPNKCPQAGRFAADFRKAADQLLAEPIVDEDGPLTYADFIDETLADLDDADWKHIGRMTDKVLKGITGTAVRDERAGGDADLRYWHKIEVKGGVFCTDAAHPRTAEEWSALAAKADERAPYFGRRWVWDDVMCAGDSWTVQDEDAYKGPFDKRTAAPVLVVGNYWDPATNYDDAAGSAKLLPNSRLLTNDTWGHTAYGTSACATGAMDEYLLTGDVPAEGTVCKGDRQPYESNAAPKPNSRDQVTR